MISSEEMTCTSPDLTELIKGARCAATSKRRKKRATDIYSWFEFQIGFKLEELKDFVTVSDISWLKDNSYLILRPDPHILTFNGNQRIKIITKSQTQIDITGEDLNSGG